MSTFRQQQPEAVRTGAAIDGDYDYKAGAPTPTPTSASAAGVQQMRAYGQHGGLPPPPPPPPAQQHQQQQQVPSSGLSTASARSMDGDEALLDLAQLEELHQEAERMKALGNKHMASQEYTRAYNAYSAALQLSPVGPSSHVFLSNRAAALLSLKRYSAAATDARRAVALAPTFGKAHARLGQALYFLKEYPGAVAAYEDAIRYEPDNQVTVTYLEKAKSKMEKHARKARGEDMSVLTGDSTQFTIANSIATDPNATAGVVTSGYRGNASALLNAANGPKSPKYSNGTHSNNTSGSSSAMQVDYNVEDPDFDEALRIQLRANKFLANKQYKASIEEYTAALFLVPDDPNLSPDLHMGRAHALNGSRRHESARNDSVLAIRLSPSPAAYSTLAKSLFYMKDYRGSVDAFRECQELLPRGEGLGMFDKAYLQKAQAALEEEESSLVAAGRPFQAPKQPVPKLAPPRFVPREQAINSSPSLPPMPKQWPQQSPRSPTAFKCGPEREVHFISEALGIKLNRGSDGLVRVLSVSPNTPASPVARNGRIEIGDVVREVVGVDIRRPITNIMWGDTVALIKMAPRPIVLIVAQEISEVPQAVAEELRKAALTPTGPAASVFRPSPSSGDGSTKDLVETQQTVSPAVNLESTDPVIEESLNMTNVPSTTTEAQEVSTEAVIPSLLDEEEEEEEGEEEAPVEEAGAEDVVDADIESERQADEQIEEILEEVKDLPTPSEDAAETETLVALSPEPVAETLVALSPELVESSAESGGKEVEEVESVEGQALVETKSGEVAGVVDGIASTTAEERTETVAPEEVAGVVDDIATSAEERTETVAPEEVAGVPVENATTAEEETDTTEQGSSDAETNTVEQAAAAAVDSDVQAPTSQGDAPMDGSLRDEEDRIVEGEILFMRSAPAAYNGWDSLRWMSYSGARKVCLCQSVFRLVEAEKKTLFWTTVGSEYVQRSLLVYKEPNLILVVRSPKPGEVATLLDLTDEVEIAAVEKAVDTYHVVESVIEPQTCKLRLSPLTTVTSLAPEGANLRRRSCFEIITPFENIVLSPVRKRENAKKGERSFADSGAFMEALATETAIAQVLCSAHENEEDIGNQWRHQLILGTLQAHVLSGNQKMLEQAIQYAVSTINAAKEQDDDPREAVGPGQLPSKIVDARDGSGNTALYYACARRMSPAVSALVKAGADVTFKTFPDGLTPCHICAENLDDKSLSTILASSARPDPNVLDISERTPMHVAVIDGHAIGGARDSVALERCIMALEAWGGQMVISAATQWPVSFLSSSWRAEDLAVVLDHLHYRYPLKSADVLDTASIEESISAHYRYPLHSCLIALRREMAVTTDEKQTASESSLCRTLRVLLEHGFEPNERVEQPVQGSFHDDPELGEFVGFTPLQVVASIALEFEATKRNMQTDAYVRARTMIADAAELLVRNGARTGVDAPLTKRVRRKKTTSKSSSIGSSQDEDASEVSVGPDVERSSLKLESKPVLELIGGEDRLSLAKKEWVALKAVNATIKVSLYKDEKQAIPDSDAAGGSSEKSCAVCWKVFGMLNRKHRCRVLRCHVCDDCSTKRLIEGGVEYRVSDGQFLLAAVDAGQAKSDRLQAKYEELRISGMQQQKADDAASRLERLEAQENANRDSLFGGVIEQAANYVFGEEEDASSRPARQVEGLAATMGQTRDALNERGEKLNTLNEKSEQLVNASADFAKMAKELRRKSESQSRWFG